MAKMTLLFAALIALASGVSGAPSAHSEVVLKKSFKDNDHWPRTKSEENIEFCGGDWCQEVEFKHLEDRGVAWDALLLMFYAFDASESTKPQLRSHWAALLRKKGHGCGGGEREATACVLDRIQKAHSFVYRRINYDIGHRCVSFFTTKPPYFSSVGACEALVPEVRPL